MTRILLGLLLCAGVAHADTLSDTAAFADAITKQTQRIYSTTRARSATSWRTPEQLRQKELKKAFYRVTNNTITWNDDTVIHLDDNGRVSKMVYKGQPGCTRTWTPQKTWLECAGGAIELLHGPNGTFEFGPGTHITDSIQPQEFLAAGFSGPHPVAQALNRYTKTHPQEDLYGFVFRLVTEQSFAHGVLSSARRTARPTHALMTSLAPARPAPAPPATHATSWWGLAALSACVIVVTMLTLRARRKKQEAAPQTAETSPQDSQNPHDATKEQP